MRFFRISILFCLFILLLGLTSFAAWTNYAPGIDYQEFSESSPVINEVFVTRMDRSVSTAIIDTCLGLDIIPTGREIVSSMATRKENDICFWGNEWGKYRYDVVAAINGSFFNTSNGAIIGGYIQSGSLDKRPEQYSTVWVPFVFKDDRSCFIAGSLTVPTSGNKIYYVHSGQSQSITNINTSRSTDDLIIYTPQYDSTTGTNEWGYEVLVELTTPPGIVNSPDYITGIVRAKESYIGDMDIPFNHIVISAHGTAISTLSAGTQIGSEVRITQQVTEASGKEMPGTYAYLRGYYSFLRNGVVYDADGVDSMLTARHPRTAIAYNSNYIFFVVCDGRSLISLGMSMEELGNFCKNRLGATEGLNLDGGGSSTMWLDGTVKNNPSDGSERPVSNGIMMISLIENNENSSEFGTGYQVSVDTSSYLRRGPGTSWTVLDTLTTGTIGTVRENSVNGVYADGHYWWNCVFGDQEGWIAESQLSLESVNVSLWMLY